MSNTPNGKSESGSLISQSMASLSSVNCQRCGSEISREKASSISSKKRTMYFCDNCFKAVFKYDENMKTVNQLWEENGRRVPFIVRSSNWHRSSYMLIKNVNTKDGELGKEGASSSQPSPDSEEKKNGKKPQKQKLIFVGDMYLRGVLKEQDRAVGKANHFIWYRWSEELAQKYKEPEPPKLETES